MVIITQDMIKQFQNLAETIDEPLKITFELVDCLNWRIENEIDKILWKPIIPAEFYRSVRDSQLIGMSGYTKDFFKDTNLILTDASRGRPVIAIGVGLSTYDKASIHCYVQSHIQINEYRDRVIMLLTVISSIDDLNYPEKTDTYYIVNAPYVFSACWKIMDYESLPHFCRRQGSGSSRHAKNTIGDDCCFSLDHGFHQQLYNYTNQQAAGIKPRAPVKQGSFHVGFPEPDLTNYKIARTIETEFHKLENQNGFTDEQDDLKSNGDQHLKETNAEKLVHI
ncbi:CRAL-TRIO domain-containing protein [Cynara cardunculus var. scolymus]|uniref:CRAL-TRIO domain-containing protein n=1 Tax=Cynara cardunculus var. scolymus TaxID=59895 RepID=A0A103Y4K2_CYNCS|nr:CRAL-TRIO domain-containing protein [Cynara cardunculus var. scolymus]